VQIVDLARNMIRLSGKEPDRDIAIEFIGARPGEKLHEVLWNDDETVSPTAHAKILVAERPLLDAAWLDEELNELERLVEAGDTLELVSRLGAIVREPRRAGAEEAASRAASSIESGSRSPGS
jgi:FlaA1/EpsC-like NDP-sugar epimerase